MAGHEVISPPSEYFPLPQSRQPSVGVFASCLDGYCPAKQFEGWQVAVPPGDYSPIRQMEHPSNSLIAPDE